MNLFTHFRDQIAGLIDELAQAGELPQGLDLSRITVEPPRDASHGDVTTNAAMLLAKPAKKNPRQIAALLASKVEDLDGVTGVEIAGPGFINMRLGDDFWQARLRDILDTGKAYGDSAIGADQKVNVEYVSANPTGPMHVGHARGAVFGDALAALLEKAGFAVSREYYINDAGAQVDVLARSLHLRYREALGEDIGDIPEGLYPGDYLVEPGQALAKRDGDKWKGIDEAEWLPTIRDFAIEAMMDMIRDDLKALGVEHAVFSSERELVRAGKVDEALDFLKENGLIYEGVLEPPKGKLPDDWEEREQTLFKASDFGDDVDRPVMKSDGSWTYFATDMAYHLDKYRRGFGDMIDVWGADHGGYVKRMQAAIKALTGGEGALDVKLCNMVSLSENGQPVKMSKRAGTFVTLRDVVEKVGKDVVRFIMLTRKNDMNLEFDFAKVQEQSKDNPVFYVQYAHARVNSARRMAKDELGDVITDDAVHGANLGRLTDESELALLKLLSQWPRIVDSAALHHEPHRIAFFLNDVAAEFHGLWNKGNKDKGLRFVIADDAELTLARLAMIQGVANVIGSGLDVFGVKPVQEMR
ncbi:arginine--tRNA ligase [Magnetovibrio sp. PR-2]|uniref:arginine--tRNA ligase n=1 Tax=Magnetovibrio sp. PR-2 TaxID=3120356 RepID=UPI002FCE5FA2